MNDAPKISAADRKRAKESLKTLRTLSEKYQKSSDSIEFTVPGEQTRLTLPVAALDELKAILEDMAEGKASQIISEDEQLTTQQAADYLNVSRPFVVKLMESGEIPFTKVGKHRRVTFSDLKAYQHRQNEVTDHNLKKLAQQAQDLDLGY